jgi:hypothetical protein
MALQALRTNRRTDGCSIERLSRAFRDVMPFQPTATASRFGGAVALCLVAIVGGLVPARAQTASVAIELNKLEPRDGGGCRAYMVVTNSDTAEYDSFKLDLVMFQSDGVIGRRFAVELGPLKSSKKSVKLFDLEDMACDKLGSFLINDVLECKSNAQVLDNCLSRMTVSSLTPVQLSK